VVVIVLILYYAILLIHILKLYFFFGIVQRINTLFASSTKRWKILLDNVSSLTLKPFSQTHWKSQIESLKAIKFQTPQIFLFNFKKLKSLDDDSLQNKCLNIENFLKHDIYFDIVGLYLFS
jgi:hypothetical protein